MIQNAMQTTLRLHSHVEVALKEAAAAQQPISVRDMFQKPDVHAVAKSEQQVRDLMKSFALNKLALQLPVVDASGDKRARVGFMWNGALSETESAALRDRMTKRTVALTSIAKKAAEPIVHKELPAADVEVAKKHQDVELVFGAVSISIGKNEITGAVRITFQM